VLFIPIELPMKLNYVGNSVSKLGKLLTS